MNKVIENMKRFLPASSLDMKKFFESVTFEMSKISDKQNNDETTLEQIEKKLSELATMHSELQIAVSIVKAQSMALVDLINPLFASMFEKNQELKKISTNMDVSIQQISHNLRRSDEQINILEQNIDDIRHGDLFRRIEFLQTRIVFLEKMVQSNFLSSYDQKNNATYSFIVRMRNLFQIKKAVDVPMVRIGRKNDGGYVMADSFDGKRVAYSFGIANDVSWDEDMASRGFDVYMYDHTIERLPKENKRFHFHKIGLGGKTDCENPSLKTLAQLIDENNHIGECHMILKIDIEGNEWAVLRDLEDETLRKFSQIVFEFHNLTSPKMEEIIREAVAKLNRTHQLVHLHPNNYGGYLQLGGAVLPELVEATYLLREEYQFQNQAGGLPSPLDEPNCEYLPDIFLGAWNV